MPCSCFSLGSSISPVPAWHAPPRRPAHVRLLASCVASTISLAHCKLREKPHTLEHLLVSGFGCGKEGQHHRERRGVCSCFISTRTACVQGCALHACVRLGRWCLGVSAEWPPPGRVSQTASLTSVSACPASASPAAVAAARVAGGVAGGDDGAGAGGVEAGNGSKLAEVGAWGLDEARGHVRRVPHARSACRCRGCRSSVGALCLLAVCGPSASRTPCLLWKEGWHSLL